MNILVTGSSGFIGKNLCLELKNNNHTVFEFDSKNSDFELIGYIENADFIIHLAGINRPLTNAEFYDGNVNFTIKLIDFIKKSERNIPILLSSSIHAEKDNDYGKSKKMAEDIIIKYGESTETNTYIFRLANAFGKWCKPNYNSVVATFCYNIANNIEIQISDFNTEIPFVYIDDIVHEFISCLDCVKREGILSITPIYSVKIGDLANIIKQFKNSRYTYVLPDMNDDFVRKLYSTYLTYLSEDAFKYPLKMNLSEKGSFSEFLKTDGFGQVSINVTKTGEVKGNHWHHTKNEKFLVVSGKGIVRLRKLGSNQIIEYLVDDQKLEVLDIPPGYTHNIENLGNENLVTVMWCNELYNPEKPDTFFEIV